MSRFTRWFYLEYLGVVNCPRDGIPCEAEAGTILGSIVFKYKHVDRFYSQGKEKKLIWKVCYN